MQLLFQMWFEQFHFQFIRSCLWDFSVFVSSDRSSLRDDGSLMKVMMKVMMNLKILRKKGLEAMRTTL